MKKILLILKLMFKSFRAPEHVMNVYFAPPGNGKTTFAAWVAKKAIKHGVTVFSNVPINGTFKYETVKDIGNYDISKCHLIIDEAGLEYDNRNFKNFPQQATRYFKLHRHYKVTIHIFSQSYQDFDLKLRNLATRYYICNKSIIPFLFRRVKYIKKISTNELTKEWCDAYVKVPFSSKWIFAPVLWMMFDSWEAPKLPEKEWTKW